MELTRRRLLVGAALGAGLVVAWSLRERHYPLPLQPGPGEAAFDAWIRVARDGAITVSVPQLEMGQGVATLMARIVAAEMGADWNRMGVVFAPVSETYANAPLAAHWAELWLPMAPDGGIAPESWLARRWAERERFNATADGFSITAYEAPLRHAAAAARMLLTQAAAVRWGAEPAQCQAVNNTIRHGAQSIGFGELAAEAAAMRAPEALTLRPPIAETPQNHPAGSTPPYSRLDGPAKVDGGWNFAGDIRLPDMLFAAIRHAPLGESAHLAGHDAAATHGIDGFVRLVEGPDWLAALATNSWAAERALAAVAPRFSVHRPLSVERIEGALDSGLKAALRDGGKPIHRSGDAVGLLGAKPPFSQRYDIAPAMAAPLETATAVARLRDGLCEIWVASQMPESTRRAVAIALDMPVASVVLYPMAAGGSFDARLECPHAVEAAILARAAGKPVMLTYTRWQEGVSAIHRPPVAAQVEARVDDGGALVAWRLRAAMPSAAREFGARALNGASRKQAMAQHQTHRDPLAMAGFVPPYAIPALSIEQAPVAVGLPTGRLRGNGHGLAAFITECFIDEIANALHREPLSYRMAMLGDDPRLGACLQQVSALAGWNGGHDDSGQGIACHRIGGGCIAAVVSARRSDQGVIVDRIAAVADIGRILHMDIARQQIEGGLIYGMALALGSAPVWQGGLPQSARLAGLNLPLLASCPQIDVDFMASDMAPADPGELGVAVAAPAIANALFSATGLRMRRLPLGSEE
ncbi:MAG: molybdopterin-dependent oxidoreductase [Sphingomonadales bacterium]|nr:molybdopterin-dependent oxidoreductase [Sphingomonadales bacterium]MDE2168839.1 molybdopterin-dependent oxidoreductase [Sphingomonadales bacterium]